MSPIMKMFYVVQLDSDIFKEKIVVPSIWLDKYDTLCLLPPVTDVAEIETLAKAQSMPKHGWQLHSVSFKQSFDTYSQAEEDITKGKLVMIKLKEEEEEQRLKEVRGKRKRKLLRFLEQYLIESDDDEEEGCGSTQDDCFMVDNVVLNPLIVKIETMKDSNEPEIHQQPRLNTTTRNSSSVHSSLQHDNQLKVAGSSSSTIRFCIVKFPSENYVTIVPSGWLKEEGEAKVCAWPPYRSLARLEKAVKNHEAPKSSWQWFGVVVIKKTDTYEKGLEYEEEAMYNSDINTQCDDTQTEKKKKSHKRKKIISQKNQSSSQDESLNSSLPPFPILKNAGTQKSTLKVTSSLQQAEYLPQNNQPTTSHSSRQFMFMTSEISSPTTPNPLQNLSSVQSPPVPNNFVADVSSVRGKEENFQKKVMRMLESLRSDVKDIMDTLKIKNCHPLPQLPPGCPKFPCENPEDLAELENILQDEGIFTSICHYLSTIGGSCVKDSTRRVLQHLMSNTLSLKYNWKGTRGIKLGFATFTLITKLILGAVRNNPSSASATEVEVNNIIKTWVMHAKDRDGGRNARVIISNGCG